MRFVVQGSLRWGAARPGLDGALRTGLAAGAVLPGPRTGLLALQHAAGGGLAHLGRTVEAAAVLGQWQQQCGSGAPRAYLDHGDTLPGPEFNRMRHSLRLVVWLKAERGRCGQSAIKPKRFTTSADL